MQGLLSVACLRFLTGFTAAVLKQVAASAPYSSAPSAKLHQIAGVRIVLCAVKLATPREALTIGCWRAVADEC